MTSSFFQTFILLLLVTDPFGNVPLFVAAMANVAPERRWRVILREIVIAFSLLFLFMFFGRYFLSALQLSEVALRIGGGTILFLIALRMVFPQPGGVMGDAESNAEPFIVPLAIPALAGPSALATVLLLSSTTRNEILLHGGALLLVALVSLMVLLAADRMQQVLGKHMMIAFERLMGLILTAIAVEMLLTGIRAFIQTL
ncbi:MAG: MarC family protein [Herbaspirillum sp.]